LFLFGVLRRGEKEKKKKEGEPALRGAYRVEERKEEKGEGKEGQDLNLVLLEEEGRRGKSIVRFHRAMGKESVSRGGKR